MGRSRDNPSRVERVDGYSITSGIQQQREPEFYFTMRNNGMVQNAREMMADGTEHFEGNDIGLWSDGMTYGNFSDDWMCLPLDAFDPGSMGLNNGFGARGLDFFRTV